MLYGQNGLSSNFESYISRGIIERQNIFANNVLVDNDMFIPTLIFGNLNQAITNADERDEFLMLMLQKYLSMMFELQITL